MSATLAQIKPLVIAGDVRISAHGYRRLATHLISADDVVHGIRDAEVVEDYPNYHAGPAVLAMQNDMSGQIIHVLWALERTTTRPAVDVTSYRPDPARWSPDLRKRLP